MTAQQIDYVQLIEDSPHASVVHRDGVVLYANPAAARMFGVTPGSAPGRQVLDFVHPSSRQSITERDEWLRTHGSQVHADEARLMRADGTEFVVETVAGIVTHQGLPAVHVICWDITDRVANEAALAHRATHDPLTGLPNRVLLEDRWRQARQRTRRSGLLPVILFCDIDGFKAINDVLGHRAGDQVLVGVARRLLAVVRGEDTLARVGGDEFVALIEHANAQAATDLASRMRDTVAGTVVAEDPALRIALSVGVAPDDPDAAFSEVLARADAAMYSDKRRVRRA